MMSFTSMVPITIFSLLTVSCAAVPSRRSRVMSTRLLLVIVLAANLLTSKHGFRVSYLCVILPSPQDAPVGTREVSATHGPHHMWVHTGSLS